MVNGDKATDAGVFKSALNTGKLLPGEHNHTYLVQWSTLHVYVLHPEVNSPLNFGKNKPRV